MNHNVARILYLFGLLLALVSVACFGSVPGERGRSPGSDNPAAEAPAGPVTITVTARDFEFELDSTRPSAGKILFIVRNDGMMPHDFAINGSGVDAKTPLLDPGETAELEVTLQPGAYTYICTVPGHVQLGMTGELTVSQ